MKASKSEHDQLVEALSQLATRLNYLDVLDERHGKNHGREIERQSLTFIIADYERREPDAMKAAMAQADWVRERKLVSQQMRDLHERKARS